LWEARLRQHIPEADRNHRSACTTESPANRSQRIVNKRLEKQEKIEMELRQLTSESERRIFQDCLTKARATRGKVGLRETDAGSRLGSDHLMFGNLFALFENENEPPERMVAGFIMHDLATLPASWAKPDLSHLPARSVLEGSELWSLSLGFGRVAGLAAAAIAGLLQAKAIVVFPVVSPIDLTARYLHLSFVNACERVKWPYGETIDGDEVWVQPMLLEGEKLEQYIRAGFDFLFQGSAGDRRSFRFDNPFAARPPDAQASMPVGQTRESNTLAVASSRQADERNGGAQESEVRRSTE
jgi:hypothetical protein